MFDKIILKFNAIKLFPSNFIVILLSLTVSSFITIILYYNFTPFPTGSHYTKYCIEKIPIVIVKNRLGDFSGNFRFGLSSKKCFLQNGCLYVFVSTCNGGNKVHTFSSNTQQRYKRRYFGHLY